MFQKGNSFLYKGDKAHWAVFLCFSLVILLKVVLFHWYCFHSILVSSLWHNPINFFVFWFPKVSISFFLAAPILLSKHKWWTVAMALLIDMWCIANMLYYRANGLFLGFESMKMAGNLHGFETSILAYWNWKVGSFLLLTICYTMFLIPIQLHNRHPKIFFIVCMILFAIQIVTGYGRYAQIKRIDGTTKMIEISPAQYLIPYRILIENIQGVAMSGGVVYFSGTDYIKEHSIIAYIPTLIVFDTTMRLATKQQEQIREQSRIERINTIANEVSPFINNGALTTETPTYNLLFILLESMESWVIDATDDMNQPITPFLQQLVKQENVAYFPKVRSQVKEGVSGDGQMICNTGLLPLQRGAACMLFDNNTFPNWAHFFPHACTFTTGSPSSWNQGKITYRYGYKELVCPIDELEWNDEQVLQKATHYLDTLSVYPFCLQIKTISTHTPFAGHNSAPLSHPASIPLDLKRYQNCAHYTDSCCSVFFSNFSQSEAAKNTIIILTGDHTIFKEMMLHEFKPYSVAHNLGIKEGKNYVPLIIYSPSSKENLSIDDECYQMDIFPTILTLIGCNQYYWKGLGVDILDSVARQHRLCTETDAYTLSDQLIRSNWFELYSTE